MSKNYFETIREFIIESPAMERFDIFQKSKSEFDISSKSENYKIKFDESKKLVSLNLMSNEKETEISSWLLDNETATQKDADLIAKDFIETMAGKEKKKVKQTKKKVKSSDESNVTGLFFANRMASFFPELKQEIQKEKELYPEFRAVDFACKKVLPRVQSLVENSTEKSRVSKFGKVLSDLYQNGTLDTRSIITMGILNFISGDKAIQNLKNSLTPDLVNAWEAALKYKNKKVNPEKSKNKKSLLSRALEIQRQQEK